MGQGGRAALAILYLTPRFPTAIEDNVLTTSRLRPTQGVCEPMP